MTETGKTLTESNFGGKLLIPQFLGRVVSAVRTGSSVAGHFSSRWRPKESWCWA